MIGGAGLITLVIVTVVIRSHAKRDEAKRVADFQGTWSALEGCLLGPELDASESPSSRFRAIQLGVVGTNHESRGSDAHPAWPGRCASYARSLADRADTASKNAIELRTSMEALAKETRKPDAAKADLGKLIDQSWGEAEKAGLRSKPSNPASCPKPVIVQVSAEAMSTTSGLNGDFAMTAVKLDPAPTRDVRFLIDDRALVGGPVLCAASGSPITLACSHLGDDIAAHSPGLSLLGTTDPTAHPWIFAGERGQVGVYRTSGTPVLHGQAVLGASVGADDSAWLLVHPSSGTPNEIRLLHIPLVGDVPAGDPLLLGNEVGDVNDVTLAWSWIVLRAGPSSIFPSHLIAHAVTGAGSVGPAVDIGDASKIGPRDATDATPRLSACRSGANIAVRLHGANADEMTFFTGEMWTAPVGLATRGGALFCDGNEAFVTDVSSAKDASGAKAGAAAFEQSRCNASSCVTSHFALADLLADTDVLPPAHGSFAVGEVARKILLVWDADRPLGGLRMRLASADGMKGASDEVLADTQGTSKAAVRNIRILSTPDSAVVLLETASGVRFVSVDGHGKITVLHTQT